VSKTLIEPQQSLPVVGPHHVRLALFQFSPNPVLLFDKDGCPLEANPAALAGLEQTGHPVTPQTWFNSLTPESAECLIDHFHQEENDKLPSQFVKVEQLAASGRIRTYELEFVPLNCAESPPLFLAIAHDLSIRQKREQELRESQAHYRAIVDEIDEVTFQLNIKADVTFVSPGITRYGFEPHELIGCNAFQFLDIHDNKLIYTSFLRGLQGSPTALEFILTNRKSTKLHQVHLSLYPIWNDDQQVGLRGVLTDLGPAREFGQLFERRAAQLAALNQLGRVVTASLSVEDAFSNTSALLRENFGYFHVALYAFPPEMDMGVVRAVCGTAVGHFDKNQSIRVGEGYPGLAAADLKTVVTNDARHDPAFLDLYRDPIRIRAQLCVPVRCSCGLTAVIDVQSPLSSSFSTDDMLIVETTATYLEVALNNADLFDRSQQRLREKEQVEKLLRLQRDVLAAVGQTLDFTATLEQILAALKPYGIFDCGSIYLVDDHGGICAAANVGLTAEFAAVVAYLPPEANKTRAVMLGQPIFTRYADLQFDPRIPAPVRQKEALLSIATIPIQHQGKVIACLTLGSHSTSEIPSELHLVLETGVEYLGIVIWRLKLEQELVKNQARGLDYLITTKTAG
jgi:GAF domain-containing protein/PAS domain-containing protein